MDVEVAKIMGFTLRDMDGNIVTYAAVPMKAGGFDIADIVALGKTQASMSAGMIKMLAKLEAEFIAAQQAEG